MKMTTNAKKMMALGLVLLAILLNISGGLFISLSTLRAQDLLTPSTPAGAGSEEAPYLISSASELLWVSHQNNSGAFEGGEYFELTKDIELEHYEWTPIGSSEHTAFEGNFDGKNFTIRNVNIREASLETEYIGLFGYIKDSTIQNFSLGILQIDLTLEEDVQDIYLGSIAGYAVDSVIKNIFTGGRITLVASNQDVYVGAVGKIVDTSLEKIEHNTKITASAKNIYAGGLAGSVYGGLIVESYNKNSVTTDATQANYSGGLVGYAVNTNFEKTYNKEEVLAKGNLVYVAGLVGVFSKEGTQEDIYEIKLSYNVGKVVLDTLEEEGSPEYVVGGLVGLVQADTTIKTSYTASVVEARENNSVTKRGVLIGVLQTGASLEAVFYDRQLNSVADYIPPYIAQGNSTGATGLSTLDAKKGSSYGNPTTSSWKFNTDWVEGTNLSKGYPILKYVGNYAVDIQVAGGGVSNPKGVTYYDLKSNTIIHLTPNNGYQVDKILHNGEYISYKGNKSRNYAVNYSPDIKVHQVGIMFRPIPFTQTQPFYYLMGTAAAIVIMIVGAGIINYRYATKMDKIMVNKKKSIKIDDAPKTKDNTPK